MQQTVSEASVKVPTGRWWVWSPEKGRQAGGQGTLRPVEELGRQFRRRMDEVANTGDTCKDHGQPNFVSASEKGERSKVKQGKGKAEESRAA